MISIEIYEWVLLPLILSMTSFLYLFELQQQSQSASQQSTFENAAVLAAVADLKTLCRTMYKGER